MDPCHQAGPPGQGCQDQVLGGDLSLSLSIKESENIITPSSPLPPQSSFKDEGWKGMLCKNRPALSSRPGSKHLSPLGITMDMLVRLLSAPRSSHCHLWGHHPGQTLHHPHAVRLLEEQARKHPTVPCINLGLKF